MALSRPTLNELRIRIKADLDAALSGTQALVRWTLSRVFSVVFAAVAHALYGYLDWSTKQQFIKFADRDFLLAIGARYNLNLIGAQVGVGTGTATGVDTTPIPVDSIIQRGDGTQYKTTTAQVISGGTATLDLEALDAGAAPNVDAGEVLTFVTPLAGVDSDVTVDSGGITGSDEETTEQYRARLLLRAAAVLRGGNAADYKSWVREVRADVTRVFSYSLYSGPGTVGVTFLLDDNPTSIIPSASVVAQVDAYLQDKKPEGVLTLDVFAPTAVPLNPVIDLSPNTAAVQAAVAAELDQLTRDLAPGQTLLLSKFREAVSKAAGEDDNNVISPVADTAVATDAIVTVGVITFGSL